jgi:serine protease Do
MKRIIVGLSLVAFFALGTQAQEVVVIKQNKKDSADKPLMVVDGVIQENKNMNDISPNDIQSVNVYKGPLATEKYGKKGEKGVVEIITKGKGVRIIDTNNISITVDGDQILLNGEKIDPKDPRLKKIKRINVIGKPLAPTPPQGPMNKAFLGVATKASSEGALIVDVNEGSPAEKAGLKEDDIITQVNKEKIEGPSDLYKVIGQYKADDKITIEYIREGKKNQKEIVLAKNKMDAIAASPNNNFNNNVDVFKLEDDEIDRGFDKKFRRGFALPDFPNIDEIYVNTKKPKLGISIEDLEEGNGVKITMVNKYSPADKAGLKVGDIITSIDKHDVKEVNDIKWQYFEAGQTIKLNVNRNKENKIIEVKIPKKINSADL